MDSPKTLHTQSADGTYIAYSTFGDGPIDILVIHPWLSHLEIYWEWPGYERFVRGLADGARVILFDKRGVGLSDPIIRTPDLETRMEDATVLFTDIVGSTAIATAEGDAAWRTLVERHHHIVRGALARYRGTEMDTAGDGFFATFDGPARAIRCALAIAEGVQALSIGIRAGVHTGEMQLIDGKAGGIAVTIGARIMAKGGPSEVLVSQTVKDLVAGSGLTFEDAGEHELKGVPDRWRLYRVLSS